MVYTVTHEGCFYSGVAYDQHLTHIHPQPGVS